LIFFDLDDTLLDHKTAANGAARQFYERYSGRLPYSQGEFLALWDRLAEKYVDAYLRGDIGWDDQRRMRIRDVFQPFEPSLSNDEVDIRFGYYRRAYEDNWALFADVGPCLEALCDQPLGIITNGSVSQQNKKLRNLGIRDHFKTVVISEAVGSSKPDARIFMESCRLAGTRPQDCVYVGDRLDTDARASSAVGMTGVWINRHHDEKAAGSSGVAVIRSLDELPGLVQELQR